MATMVTSWSGQKRAHPGDLSTDEVEGDVDLPEVDDLEVAALAAQALPEWLREDGQANSSSSEEYTSSEESSDSASSAQAAAPKAFPTTSVAQAPSVECRLTLQGEEHVSITLLVHTPGAREGVDEHSDDESEVFDANQLQDIVDAMTRAGPDDDEDPTSALQHKQAVPALVVTVTPADTLIPVGTIASCFEGMIVVKAYPGQLLEEGSVLCLGHDKLLGRVDELFGPVEAPMYSLQYAGGGQMPPEAAAGSAVLAVQRLATYLDATSMVQQRSRADEDAEGDEAEFSDDDAEAAFRAARAGDYRDNDLALAASFAGQGPAMAGMQSPGRGARGRRGRGPSTRGGQHQDGGRSAERGRSGGRGGRGFPVPQQQQQQQQPLQQQHVQGQGWGQGQQQWNGPPPSGQSHYGGADALQGPGRGGYGPPAQQWQQEHPPYQQQQQQQQAPSYGRVQSQQHHPQAMLMAMPLQYQSLPGQMAQTAYPGFGIPQNAPSLAYGQVPAAVNAAYAGHQPSQPYPGHQSLPPAGNYMQHPGQQAHASMPAGQQMHGGGLTQQGQMRPPQQHLTPTSQQSWAHRQG